MVRLAGLLLLAGLWVGFIVLQLAVIAFEAAEIVAEWCLRPER